MSFLEKYPKGLAALFMVEMWERFSYYGMRAMLVLFLIDKLETGGLGIERAQAAAIYGLYTASVYILALPGGWIADRLWGCKRAILVGGLVIMIGHVLLAISGAAAAIFYLGLVCIAVGTGLLKPNISTMVGTLYAKNDIGGRDAGFSFFYMGINIGAILGGLIAGYLGEVWGWHWGFGAAAVAMAAGLVNFLYASRSSLAGKGRAPAAHHHPDAATGKPRPHVHRVIVGAIVLLLGSPPYLHRADRPDHRPGPRPGDGHRDHHRRGRVLPQHLPRRRPDRRRAAPDDRARHPLRRSRALLVGLRAGRLLAQHLRQRPDPAPVRRLHPAGVLVPEPQPFLHHRADPGVRRLLDLRRAALGDPGLRQVRPGADPDGARVPAAGARGADRRRPASRSRSCSCSAPISCTPSPSSC